ncbi:hypothetical protein GNF10_16265 [Nostoc sp. UCD121]|uniref:hypothetical protein n=1 Tax=unclassified Nostoc TaxID=2593658 RepID=UPI001624173D|nr:MULTISPECIES: hypothetical protein [unclassified Nostoc]MBC1219878.1 hypothetical protein [Nostoc sp. UCD120]MBC1277469.1 hypothetical protein [Nostoc sp. UCD121]MBC1294127.1 hypothetical protein [Nostoc sp. UCD122]
MNSPEEYINNNSSNIEKQNSNANINELQFSNNSMSEGRNLDKVREILFGNQTRDTERRFNRLEERLIKELGNVRDETRKRLDALEIYIKQEVDSLTQRLKNEQVERDSQVKAVAEESKSIIISLEKKITQFDEQATNSQRELREQILNQSKSLQDEIQQKSQEIVALLEREAQELRREKTDRSNLAAMFTELAIRLNAENKS